MGKNYNVEKINTVVAKFASHGYKPSEVDIYFDLDNTLALFSYYGNGGDEEACRKMYTKGYYKELPVFSEAPETLEALKDMGFNLFILSSCIDTPFCRSEKLAWTNYHFPFIDNENIIFIDNGKCKADYITRPDQSILVDDYFVNLCSAYEVGIVGIKKTYTGKKRPLPQVSSLVDIFPVLYRLNCLNR